MISLRSATLVYQRDKKFCFTQVVIFSESGGVHVQHAPGIFDNHPRQVVPDLGFPVTLNLLCYATDESSLKLPAVTQHMITENKYIFQLVSDGIQTI